MVKQITYVSVPVPIMLLIFAQCYAAVVKIDGLKFMMNGIPVTLQFPNVSQDKSDKTTIEDNEIVTNLVVDAVSVGNATKVKSLGSNQTEADNSNKTAENADVRTTKDNFTTTDDSEEDKKSLRRRYESIPNVYVPIDDIPNPEFIGIDNTNRKHFRDGLALIDRAGSGMRVDLKP